ncbi:MAG: hypothetical protein HY692_06810 [Cyanobacteria bacterium NC_groundwater_1444_Ag_S-0.65um_54_12]|nr:hypothetical protein [Cyanobacteria bacterium NC_groundwater_1444_Ag_S-0.65um_54_12]
MALNQLAAVLASSTGEPGHGNLVPQPGYWEHSYRLGSKFHELAPFIITTSREVGGRAL